MASRVLLGVLLTALVTGAGAWVAWAAQVAEKPSTAEVVELIETRSPYIVDQKQLNEQTVRVRQLEQKLQEVQRDVTEVKTMLVALARQLDKIEGKLDDR
jgi:TolA-binding protein